MVIEATDVEEKEKVLSKNDARQGLELHAMRYVLGISLGMAIVAMIVTYFLMF